METKITKGIVERTKPPRTGQMFIRDTQLTGFGLRVTAAGAKSFVFEGRIKGRPRRLTLDQYPAMTVLQARQRVLEIKAAIARGEDPAATSTAERSELTFGALAAAYIADYARPHRKSWARDERRLEAHFGHWNSRRLSDLGRDEVSRAQQSIARDCGKVAANRAISLLRGMINWAIREEKHTGANPAGGLKFFREEQRQRLLSPDELERVNAALLQEPSEYWRAFFPLVLLLGVRKNELLGAQWADISLSEATIRFPQTKAGRSHLLPLPTAAIDILRALPRREGNPWVFPGAGKSGHLPDAKMAWQRIRQRAGVSDVTVHDLRRTLGSWLAGAGHSLPLIGKTLNHTSPNSTAIYARLDLGPVRSALEQNAQAMRLGR